MAKTVQELLNSVNNYQTYECAWADSVTWTQQNLANYTWPNGDITFTGNQKAREVHIFCDKDFSVWINKGNAVKEIPLEAADSPFVINNMDVGTIYMKATGAKVKVLAFYDANIDGTAGI